MMIKRLKKKIVQNQSGQVLVVLVLTLLTILTIGLIIIQRTTIDITTSTQNDQASRAFSAAEAGIEQALQTSGQPRLSDTLTNDAAYIVTPSAKLPLIRQALAYPPIDKGEVAQFWLADPVTLNPFYRRNDVYVYFGNPVDVNAANESKLPAIEITVITRNTTTNEYSAQRRFIDTYAVRTATNRFEACGITDNNLRSDPSAINTSNTANLGNITDQSFECRVRVCTARDTTAGSFCNSFPANETAIMIRTRILYTEDKQPIAVAPIPVAPYSTDKSDGNSLPDQATIYTSIGVSGQSRRTIQAFKLENVVPFFFDYAIFSAANIEKVN